MVQIVNGVQYKVPATIDDPEILREIESVVQSHSVRV